MRDIGSIVSLCEACSALELPTLLLKSDKKADGLGVERWHHTKVGDILARPDCDLCQYALGKIMSKAAKIPSFANLPPLTSVQSATVTIGVRDDLRNDVLPCRVLEINVGGWMDKSLGYELIPACPNAGAHRGRGPTVARVPSGTIDPQIIKTWVETCQIRHRKSCSPNTKRSFDFKLWVIDVEEMNLSELPFGAAYLALSYVWGAATAFLTTKANIDARSRQGGLQHVIQISSRVVRDAVKLTRGMGQRYIWIDQLCVVRGNSELLDRTLESMGAIYHHAAATIVAAGGSDANTGLAGVQTGSRDLDQPVLVGSGQRQFALIQRPRTVFLEEAVYLKRAWTYQEYFFSTRRIIFRDGQVNFRCLAAHWQEELDIRYLSWPTGLDHGIDMTNVTGSVDWGIERFSPDNVASARKLGGDIRARMLEFMVKEFTERELTRDGDILSAFAGVGSYLSNWLKSPICLGLSEKHFFGCLLWKLRGEYSWDKPFSSKQRPGFPTWSWASRYGPIHCSGNFYESCFDNGTNICLVDNWAPAYVWMDFHVSSSQGHLRYIDCPETGNRHVDIAKLLRGESTEPLSAFLTEHKRASDTKLPYDKENMLCFRTISITRSIRGEGRYATYWACGKSRSIWNNEGKEIGCIYVDDVDYTTWKGDAELLLISFVEGRPWEKVMDDDRLMFGSGHMRPSKDNQNQGDPSQKDEPCIGYFNVMWVINNNALPGPGMKKRVGTGIILSQFLIGQMEDELEMVDVYLL